MCAQRPDAVTVIVPIHGAAEALRRCLDSVARHTDLSRHRLLLVIDGPQDAQVEAVIAGRDLLRNPTRLGFAGAVNRGMSATSTDVVLLNSDTVVTARWLEKLIDAAYSDEGIATVTPLSNNATLCSVPRAFEENLIPSGSTIDSFGELIERLSARSYPRIPTGVGFCLYIRRAAIDDVGSFDAETFAQGYGEENDFCMRALDRGWAHVADDATFVFHEGHGSFGRSRVSRQRRAAAALSAKHPRYMRLIAEHMKRDPLAPVRERIAPRRAGELRIVHLVHGWPPFQHAGTELYAYWLAHRQRERHRVAVYARGADPARADGEAVELFDRGVRVRLVTNHFTARNPLRRNAIRDRAVERDFERFLRDERPDLVHVHHLAGHAFSLTRVAKRLGVPIVQQIHDWWFLCARVNLLDREGNRCAGPAPSRCASCATLTRVPLANRLLHAMRRSAARSALRRADAFVGGSNAIRNDYAGIVPAGTPFHGISYGIALDARREPRTPVRPPVRFGYVGSIAPHKGVHVAVEAVRGIDAELHLWGDAAAFPEYVTSMRAGANVVFEGPFAEEEKGRVYASMDVLLVPSIGLESFGFAAREAMASGVPVIASDDGALSEMFESGHCGELVPPGDAAALRAVLRRIADDPSVIDRWAERLPQPKRDDVHAEEIEKIYRSVLRR